MPLCEVCAKLDIRRLLVLTHKDGHDTYETLEHKLEERSRHADRFFTHHANLAAVRDSSPSCDLCFAIWHDFLELRAKRFTNLDSSTPGGAKSLIARTDGDLGPGQVYLTTTPENASKHGKSQLVAYRYGQRESVQILSFFDVFADRGNFDGEPHLLLQSISSFAGSDDCVHKMRRWLSECLEHHEACKGTLRQYPLPTRVLEILPQPPGTNLHIRLVNGDSRIEPFVALSYSWGGESSEMLTAESEIRFRGKLPPAALPPSMKDAVTITQALGIRFLWIDALCIFQDDPEDFARECAKMRDIYRGSIVTINGITAGKISDPLLDHRQDPPWSCSLPWIGNGKPSNTVHLRPSRAWRESSLKESPINTRGWCLQESLLAPRTLWLGSPVNIFECATAQIDEAGRITEATERYRSKALINAMQPQTPEPATKRSFVVNLLPSLVRDKLNISGCDTFTGILVTDEQKFTYYDHWREIVQHYSKRKLTQRADTLPALSGMAAYFQGIVGDEYLAGIWRRDVIRGLNWTLNQFVASNDVAEAYIAPSWSWASVTPHRVIFQPHPNRPDLTTTLVSKAEMVDCGVSPATVDPFGKIEEGFIVLRGRFLPLGYQTIKSTSANCLSPLMERVRTAVSAKHGEYSVKHQDKADQKFGLFHLCTMRSSPGRLAMESAHLLLLETCGGTDESWRRVGNIQFRLAGSLDASEDVPNQEDFKRCKWSLRVIRVI